MGFQKIVREKLKLHPFRLRRTQKLRAGHHHKRGVLSRFLVNQPRAWYRNLLISDECWLTLGGHVMNRKNTVLYDLRGNGAPDQWETAQAQFEPKVMALNIIWGGGLVFGPYFIHNRPYNSAEYVRLLRDEVFPEIHGVIGGAAFNVATWMQDGARLHTANQSMAFLNGIFGPRILSDRAIQGQPWAPNSPDLTGDYWL